LRNAKDGAFHLKGGMLFCPKCIVGTGKRPTPKVSGTWYGTGSPVLSFHTCQPYIR
jgi:hypothetical protein